MPGLVAGFQLSVNHMVMVGDWIEMPARGADGDVIDVSLTTVKVHQDMTLLVRQLCPGPHGLPLEICVFTNDIAWARYEDIQGDIFDHLLSVMPEFGLAPFQTPSGNDLERAGELLRTPEDAMK